MKTLLPGTLLMFAGAVAAFVVVGLYRDYVQPPSITRLAIAGDSDWAKEFTASTGIPVLLVKTRHRSRYRQDQFAIVGKD